MALRTSLYEEHVRAGGHLVSFGGWEMPLYYTSIREEHRAVRTAVGLFDVSHMGKLLVSGAGAARGLDTLSANGVPAEPGRARYTHLLRPDGTILDDVIFTCLAPDAYLCVCNAASREAVNVWLRERLRGPEIDDLTFRVLCLALQGPRSPELLARLAGDSVRALRAFRAAFVPPLGSTSALPGEGEGWGSILAAGAIAALASEPRPDPRDALLLTRTGYTGEVGFELFPWRSRGAGTWTALLEAGRAMGIRPVGLGARDTLRLEKGYLLSGQDFDGRQTPLEAGADRFVKWDHDFVGRAALRAQRDAGGYRHLVGLRMSGRGIPRRGCVVYVGDRAVGEVTSGTHSLSLGIGIALAYVDSDAASPGTRVDVEIRDGRHPATVTVPPFV